MDLKPLNPKAIDSAMEKANHYRLLNDPENAASICRDILELDPSHQQALVTLVLSLSDQLTSSMSLQNEARDFAEQLKDEYQRTYFTGIVCERAARGMLARTSPGSDYSAYDLFREAMEHFEKAENQSNSDNDDAVLRWNSCLRTIKKRKLVARPEDNYVPYGD